MDIGQVIKQARIEKGYTQEQLGEMVGVQKSAVAKWENGRVSEIKRTNLKMLSEALGIEPVELFGIQAEIKKDPEEAANKAADILLNPELMKLIDVYMKLDDEKRKQAIDYVEFLAGR